MESIAGTKEREMMGSDMEQTAEKSNKSINLLLIILFLLPPCECNECD